MLRIIFISLSRIFIILFFAKQTNFFIYSFIYFSQHFELKFVNIFQNNTHRNKSSHYIRFYRFEHDKCLNRANCENKVLLNYFFVLFLS